MPTLTTVDFQQVNLFGNFIQYITGFPKDQKEDKILRVSAKGWNSKKQLAQWR